MIQGVEQVDELLEAVAAVLELEESERFELLVCGGAALNALGLVTRATLDIDVVALVKGGVDEMAKPLPDSLRRAVERVARARGLPESWLDVEPGDMQPFGLPKGIVDRSHPRIYGPRLLVRFIDRYDQVHFKLHALVDQGPGKHLADFKALSPTLEEILAAGRWCMTQDRSEGFRMVLLSALRTLGYEDVAAQLG